MDHDEYPEFNDCPRCGDRGYERLKEHDCCYSCNYSTTLDPFYSIASVPDWALKTIKEYDIKYSSEPKEFPLIIPPSSLSEVS